MAPVTQYAAVTDVQTLLNLNSGSGVTIGSASVPTTTQVEGFLDQVAAEINSVLVGIGYTVPVTGANDIFMLKRFVSQKAAAMTYHAGYGGFTEPPARVTQWEEEYDNFLIRLMDRSQRLVDSAPRARMGVVLVGRYRED